MAEPYVGKFYSNDYVRRKILRQTDQEIIEQDALIEKEIKDGIIPDPSQMAIDPMTGQPIPPQPGDTSGGLMGATPQAPEVEEKKFETPTGGEI